MSIIDKLFGDNDKPRDTPAKADGPMQKVLDELASLGGKPIETLSPEEARGQPTPTDAVKSLLRKDGKDPSDDMGVKTSDITIPGAAGPIQARIYKPHDHSEDKLHPVVVYFHGGGFVIADLDVYDGGPRGVSKMADVIVVSVHYRQAPEHHFPAAHDDALAAYRWVLENAQTFRGDPQKVAVMGESAGGNLAIGVSMMARDAGLAAPKHQVLVYPVAGVDMDNESYVENADAKPLNKPMMKWFVKHIFANEADAQDPRINIVEKANLSGLPSTTVICAEIDPLRTEGELLAEKLEQAGVDVRHKTFNGSTHEFFGMAAVVPDAAAAQTFAAHELKRAFGTAILPI
ncbi:alpha/beta hydrolase [Brevundimonas sp. 'scallop']|uniref:alpha/beta hydrolase n=1 Tax=Brevundimonas sp. 'scallop' TaxID=2562582 RepID=UPI0013E166E1|nr:alpha/beta hydrolase [Brevundimonas sp. 'scallop']QIF81225.1 alpha/beta hydrolase [Brevundimonas sp. 'scallop']